MKPLSVEEQIKLALGLFKRDIERNYGGRTVGETMTGDEAAAQLLSLINHQTKLARIDKAYKNRLRPFTEQVEYDINSMVKELESKINE